MLFERFQRIIDAIIPAISFCVYKYNIRGGGWGWGENEPDSDWSVDNCCENFTFHPIHFKTFFVDSL